MTAKKRKLMRTAGYAMIFCGLAVLGLFAYRKISRELYLRRLLRDNIVFEVPSLNIRVPVLEGTDKKALAASAGHFEGTGALGKGNYCIAGHNSTIYAEVFNDLDRISLGDAVFLVDTDPRRTKYEYIVDEYKIVEPNEISVLNDFGDDRITVVSCTDDGKQRQIVVAKFRGICDENVSSDK